MNEDKIFQIKFTKHHFMSGMIYKGCPLTTSIEITEISDIANRTIRRIVNHQFYSSEETHERKENKRVEKLENRELLEQIEKINVKDLKNNYFTAKMPERFTSWELEYNYRFKIVGTFDQMPEEIKEIQKILDVEKIIEEELAKVKAE